MQGRQENSGHLAQGLQQECLDGNSAYMEAGKQMADNTLNITGYLESAIRAETLRQKAIASNVANSQTPGYRRIDVKFADIVAEAMERGSDPEAGDIEGELFRPLNTPVDGDGNDVDLDTEMGELVKNSLLQKTYMRLIGRKYRQIETAINTGTV